MQQDTFLNRSIPFARYVYTAFRCQFWLPNIRQIHADKYYDYEVLKDQIFLLIYCSEHRLILIYHVI